MIRAVRHFMGAGLCALAVLAFTSIAPSARAADKKPNIVIIWGDDIGQSDISAYSMGLMGFHTPNIDRVAKEGMIFTDYSSFRSMNVPQRSGRSR